MSLNCVLLHFKFLKRSIYLMCWFDSIRETAERLIGSLVFELSKLPWLSEVHTIAGWKRELVCTKQSETGEEREIARRKRKEVGINGFYRRLRHHATHIYFLLVAHKAWRLSLGRGSSKRIEERIYLTSTSSEVKFQNMLQDFISSFNSKWPYFTMFVSCTLSTEHLQRMLSLCGTLSVHIFSFSFITTGTRFVCEIHIYCKLS